MKKYTIPIIILLGAAIVVIWLATAKQSPLPADSQVKTTDTADIIIQDNPDNTQVDIVTPAPPTADPPAYSGATIKTTLGDIEVSFYGAESPMTVNNFINLAKSGFYGEVLFHRVIAGFMVQTGDPLSHLPDKTLHGSGGPGYTFADEINDHPLVAGSLAMANAGPHTNGSQFFIVTATSTPWLDGLHTNFGYVVNGLDVAENISRVETDSNDHPLEDIKILNTELIK